MLNQVVLVGHLTIDPEIKERKECVITLAVPRNFKNIDGEYETDFIPCRLYGNIAENTVEYCKKGDLIGIKGRVQSTDNGIEIITEKVTFLSSKKADE